MGTDYFVRLPEELYDALREDRINFHMFTVMTLLHRWANWHTGVVRTCSAERLHAALGGEANPDDVASIRTIQRALQGCHEAGWVTSGYRKGSRKPYSVTISNFIPAKGPNSANSCADADADVDAEPRRINIRKIRDWKLTKAFRGADVGADVGAERTGSGRVAGGLNETSYKTLNKTLDKTSGYEEEVSKEVSEGPARRSAAASSSQDWDDDWFGLREESKDLARKTREFLAQEFEDPNASVLDAHEISVLVTQASCEAGYNGGDAARKVGMRALLDIFLGDGWKKARRSGTTVASLRRWLANPPRGDGKSLYEQLVRDLRGRRVTFLDAMNAKAATPPEAPPQAYLEGEIEMDEDDEPSHAEQEPTPNAGQTSAMEEFKKSLSELFD